jgi:hypothetical protein
VLLLLWRLFRLSRVLCLRGGAAAGHPPERAALLRQI